MVIRIEVISLTKLVQVIGTDRMFRPILYCGKIGNRMPASTQMIAMTTRTSVSVYPPCRTFLRIPFAPWGWRLGEAPKPVIAT